MFDVDKFKSLLDTQWMGREMLYHEELESTNSYLKQLPSEELEHGVICFADYQSKGRGQYERNWESEPGANLTFTLGFIPPKPERLHVLTLSLARAVVGLIENDYGPESCIKWPNDVVANGRKMGGLLTEAIFNGNELDRVLVGIGLNINQSSFPDELGRKATSLRIELDQQIDREKFLAAFMDRAEHAYNLWLENDQQLILAINRKIIGYGRWVNIDVNGSEEMQRCKLLGVNEKGELVLIDEEAEVLTFSYEQIRIIPD